MCIANLLAAAERLLVQEPHLHALSVRFAAPHHLGTGPRRARLLNCGVSVFLLKEGVLKVGHTCVLQWKETRKGASITKFPGGHCFPSVISIFC